MKRRLILMTLFVIAVLVFGLPLVATLAGQARAAALIDVNGGKVLILTVDEYNAAITRAQADVAAKVKASKCEMI